MSAPSVAVIVWAVSPAVTPVTSKATLPWPWGTVTEAGPEMAALEYASVISLSVSAKPVRFTVTLWVVPSSTVTWGIANASREAGPVMRSLGAPGSMRFSPKRNERPPTMAW